MGDLHDPASSSGAKNVKEGAKESADHELAHDLPSQSLAIAQVLNAILLGITPAAILLLSLGALDYLASRAFYSSGYVDPDAAMIKESVVEDYRFTELRPYDDYSIEVFASSDLASNWKNLDPVIQARIWLRSMYPIPRPESDIESNSTTSVLKIAGINERYDTTTNPVELYSRAVSAGRPNDVIAFLGSYKECSMAASCKDEILKEQITMMVFASYVLPAKDMLLEGQCARASYVTKKASEILEALDLSREDDNSVVDLTRQLNAIAEHPSCARYHSFIRDSLKEIECCNYSPIEMSDWPHEFRELRDYGVGIRKFDSGDYVGAIAQFRSVRTSSHPALSEMAAFMSIRSLFWSVVYGNRDDLWARKTETLDDDQAYALIPASVTPSEARKEIEKLIGAIKSRSLLSDVEEYQAELLTYEGMRQ